MHSDIIKYNNLDVQNKSEIYQYTNMETKASLLR